MRVALLLIVLTLASACSPAAPRDPGYEPRPDPTLFREAAAVDGIEKADLWFDSSATNRGYRGRLVVADDLDRDQAARAVSTVFAILRQGRPDESIIIRASQGDAVLDELPDIPLVGTKDELERIYGPQPGDGRPPS